MSTLNIESKKYAKTIGIWASYIIIVTFIIYIICFVGILLTSPLFVWTNLNDYIGYVQNNNMFLAEFAKFTMMVMGFCYVILINALHEFASIERKIFSRISLSFGTAFMIAISIHYFVQISGVRLSLADGNINGLEHFVQANPHSIISSINMLGWTILLGISSFFMVAVFDIKHKLLRISFLASGINGLLGGFAFVFDIIEILAFTMYLGLGACVLLFSIGSIRYLKN